MPIFLSKNFSNSCYSRASLTICLSFSLWTSVKVRYMTNRCLKRLYNDSSKVSVILPTSASIIDELFFFKSVISHSIADYLSNLSLMISKESIFSLFSLNYLVSSVCSYTTTPIESKIRFSIFSLSSFCLITTSSPILLMSACALTISLSKRVTSFSLLEIVWSWSVSKAIAAWVELCCLVKWLICSWSALNWALI